MDNQILDLAYRIVHYIDEKQGEDIVLLDLSRITTICDYFVIASTKSARQAKAIINEIEDRLAKDHVFFAHKEGYDLGRWVLLDYGDIIVHVFHEEERAFYNIERIWKDAITINLDKFVNSNI